MMWSGNLLNNISSLLSFLIVCFSFHVFLLLGGNFFLEINEAKVLKQTKQTTPQKQTKAEKHTASLAGWGAKRVKGLVRAQAKDVFGTFFFFSCLENLPDYFFNIPSALGPEARLGLGQRLQSLALLSLSEPPDPKRHILFASDPADRKYLPLETPDGGGRWPFLNLRQDPAGIQTSQLQEKQSRAARAVPAAGAAQAGRWPPHPRARAAFPRF